MTNILEGISEFQESTISKSKRKKLTTLHENQNSRFVWIEHSSRLLGPQLSTTESKVHTCDRCLHHFRSEWQLKKHEEDCVHAKTCRIKLPEVEDRLNQFKNYKKQEPVPFTIYVDFIGVLEECNKGKNKYTKHNPASIGLYIKCAYDDSLSYYKSYRGSNRAEWFIKQLNNICENGRERLQRFPFYTSSGHEE